MEIARGSRSLQIPPRDLYTACPEKPLCSLTGASGSALCRRLLTRSVPAEAELDCLCPNLPSGFVFEDVLRTAGVFATKEEGGGLRRVLDEHRVHDHRVILAPAGDRVEKAVLDRSVSVGGEAGGWRRAVYESALVGRVIWSGLTPSA